MMMRRAAPHIPALCLLTALCLFPWLRSLHYSFVWDDSAAVVQDHRTHSLRKSLLAFVEPVDRLYRPIRTISFAIDDRLGRSLTPGVSHHASNLFFYWLTVLSFYAFLSVAFGNVPFAFAASALFAAHPVHAETVAWVSGGRADLLAAPLLFLSLVLLVRVARAERFPIAAFAVSLILFALSLLSKESILTMALVPAVLGFATRKADPSPNIHLIAWVTASLVGVTVVYVLVRSLVVPFGQAMSPHGNTIPARLATVAPAFLDYFRLAALPLRQCAVYVRPDAAPPFAGALIPFAAVIGLLLLAAFFLRRHVPIAAVAVAWWFLALLPVMNLLPLAMIQAERFLFLPSAAWCMIAGSIVLVRRPAVLRIGLCAALLVLLCVYVFLSSNRMPVWSSDRALWADTVTCAPDSFIAQFNFGNNQAAAGDARSAESAFRKTLKIRPDFYPACEGLANLYGSAGRYADAAAALKSGLRYAPDPSRFYLKLGYAYERMGGYDEAILWYTRAHDATGAREILKLVQRARDKARRQ